MSFNIKSLSLQELPRLDFDLRVLISKNEGKVRNVLSRAERLNGLGATPDLARQGGGNSLGDQIKRNNPNISEDEIRAWVWYRRSIGIPMKGWEKYFIASSTKQTGKANNGFTSGCLIMTTRDTRLLDRDWKPAKLIPAGSNCGAWTGREHTSNDNKTYLFCRSSEGILIVCKDDVTPVASGVKQKDDDLKRLVKSQGPLFVLLICVSGNE